MNRTSAVSRIKEGLSFRTSTSLDATIILRLQEAQRLLEKGQTLPWFLAQQDQSMSGTGADGTVSLPTGFIRVIEGETFRVVTTEGATRFLKRVDYDWLVEYLQDAEGDELEGDPIYFALRNTTIEVAPVPAAAYTIYVSYYKADDTLDSATDNDWLTYMPEILIGSAGLSLARDLNDDAAIKNFSALYAAANAALLREIADREQTGREVVMGGLG